MKRVVLIVLLNVALLSLMGISSWVITAHAFHQDSDVINCVVTSNDFRVATVKCDTVDRTICTNVVIDNRNVQCAEVVLDIPVDDWVQFKEWGKFPITGTLLKAKWVNNKFVPIKSCVSLLPDECQNDRYCRPPAQLSPLNCGAPLSERVRRWLTETGR